MGLDLLLQPLHAVQRGGILCGLQGRVVPVLEGLAELSDALGDHIVDRALNAAGHFLGQLRHAQAVVADDLAVVGLQFAGDQFQQRGLALAVAPDQANALAAVDDQAGVIQHGLGAEGEGNLLEGDQWHGCGTLKRVRIIRLPRLASATNPRVCRC